MIQFKNSGLSFWQSWFLGLFGREELFSGEFFSGEGKAILAQFTCKRPKAVQQLKHQHATCVMLINLQ